MCQNFQKNRYHQLRTERRKELRRPAGRGEHGAPRQAGAADGRGPIAFKYFSEEKPAVGVPAAALALLFQPFLKIHLGRGVWNVVDVIAAIALVALFFYEMKIENES